MATIPAANNNDSTDYISQVGAGSSEVCYFTASRRNEQAGEAVFNGADHGVFTYYLVQQLNGNCVLWNDLHTSVTATVADFMEDAQHPMLTVAFVNQPIFGLKKAIVETNTPPSLWEIYNSDHISRDKVTLAIKPNKTTLAVGDQLSFDVGVGAKGYLVVLERDVHGTVRRLFPVSRDAVDGQVYAGQTLSLPGEGKAYSPDRPGIERVRALLFTSRDAAQNLLTASAVSAA